MSFFLGIDGGGTKTTFLLIDDEGRVRGTHTAGSAYYLQVGWDTLRTLLSAGITTVCDQAQISPSQIQYAFIGLPAYGEDSGVLPALDAIAAPQLPAGRYRCGNDAQCGWAGALACEEGINLIAGTGSLAYGESQGRAARAGGWGEGFSDEGSAYWIAREGLRLFSRMADGREARGALYERVREHFALSSDLDLCAAIYGQDAGQRSDVAALAPLMAAAATAGDTLTRALFTRAADELVQMVDAVRRSLAFPEGTPVNVSYSGSLFRQEQLLLEPLRMQLATFPDVYRLTAPRLDPGAGAALNAARLGGHALGAQATATLRKERAARP